MIKQSKPFIYKRIFAYVIDIFIVSMIASLITVFFPSNEVYQEKMGELTEITEKFQKEEISESEYLELSEDINYQMSKETVDSTIVIIAVTLLYFVLLNYHNNGMTIGKRLMKIKIIGVNDQKLTINHYLLRCLIINSVLANIVTVILIQFLSKEKYLLYNSKISTLFSIVYVVCFIFVLYRNDGRGLHDLLCKTEVVSIDNIEEKEEVLKDEKISSLKNIKEAEYTEKEEILETKKKTKNSRKKGNKEKGSDK